MSSSKKARAHVIVSGRVQGVNFRQNTKQVATRHKVTGWVCNLPDGRVEAVFEGDEMAVNEVIEWCHVGPPKSSVQDVSVKFQKYSGEFAYFRVNY